MYVKALFEFTAEPDTPEISLFIGEILTLTRPDSGDGWCEGTNSQGQTGLFPANYVVRTLDLQNFFFLVFIS